MTEQEFQNLAEQFVRNCHGEAHAIGCAGWRVIRRTAREITFYAVPVATMIVERYCVWLDRQGNPRFEPITN